MLTPKQQRFVAEYLIDLNATQAAIRAGYSAKTAHSQGPRLLENVDVAAAIQVALDERAERTGVTQDRVIAELAAIAFADLRDVATWDADGELAMRTAAELSDEAAAALREIRSTTSTVVFRDGGERSTVYKGVKQHDKLRALELLGKHLGMFREKVDVNVTGGFTLTQLARLAEGELDGDTEA
jgi:phage terminase small subunit